MSNYLSTAKAVITEEIEGLELLKKSLDKSFDLAMEILTETSGKIIVSGIGKSGHIAQKIASTFNSTGTKAVFVHPSEASHGDLGIIDKERDVILLLSKSGDSKELFDLVYFAKRMSNKIISVTANEKSEIGKNSDVVLKIPTYSEACPMKLAPTTSTTISLAYGDALAIALYSHNDTSPEKFKEFHPGGRLGRKLLKVKDLMHVGDKVPIVSVSKPIMGCIIEMTSKSFGITAVVNEHGVLIGSITDGDLRRHFDIDKTLLAEDIMNKSPLIIDENSLAAEALKIMNKKGITSLFVTNLFKKPIGIIHVHDCLSYGVDE